MNAAEESQIGVRRLEVGYWLLAAVLGFLQICADPHTLRNSDAMSYLDIADAYRRRDWQAAISAYWGPLYSWLLALGLSLGRPSPYWKFAALHVVNFVIYLFALGCFACLLHELSRVHRRLKDDLVSGKLSMLPEWALIALGYPLFIWTALYLISVQLESPDMLVAAFVYLASALLLRVRRQPSGWKAALLLGVVLGCGYLAKSVMLPIGLIFLATTSLLIGSWRRAVPRIAGALALFLLIAGPFILAISRTKGRVTFGETGRLNYLWAINRIPSLNWQGEPAGYGQLRHPTRQIFRAPPIYEFGEPIPGTYPPWYDPTYWYEGSAGRFDARQQLRVFERSAGSYYDIFRRDGVQYALLVGLLSLFLMRRPVRLVLEDVRPCWFLLVPATAAMTLYSMIHVESRYVAPFITILWLSLFSAIRLPDTEARKLIPTVGAVLAAVLTCTVVASSGGEAVRAARVLAGNPDALHHEQWQVADGLREMGLLPAEKVAVIGFPLRAFWAHLAGLQIIAEMPEVDAAPFWEADTILRQRIVQAFARTGAKAIVAETPPPFVDLSGWLRIGHTSYYLYLLEPAS